MLLESTRATVDKRAEPEAVLPLYSRESDSSRVGPKAHNLAYKWGEKIPLGSTGAEP